MAVDFARVDAVMTESFALVDEGRLRVTREDYGPRTPPEVIAAIVERQGPLPPGLSVERWFDLALEARFYDGWLFLCERGRRESASAAEVRSEMERYARPLFPTLNLARFGAK